MMVFYDMQDNVSSLNFFTEVKECSQLEKSLLVYLRYFTPTVEKIVWTLLENCLNAVSGVLKLRCKRPRMIWVLQLWVKTLVLTEERDLEFEAQDYPSILCLYSSCRMQLLFVFICPKLDQPYKLTPPDFFSSQQKKTCFSGEYFIKSIFYAYMVRWILLWTSSTGCNCAKVQAASIMTVHNAYHRRPLVLDYPHHAQMLL